METGGGREACGEREGRGLLTGGIVAGCDVVVVGGRGRGREGSHAGRSHTAQHRRETAACAEVATHVL